MIIYAVYKVFKEEPNKGYFWGKWLNATDLAYGCFHLGKVCDDIKIVTYDGWDNILPEIEW